MFVLQLRARMPHVVAERFLASGKGWVDLATSESVRLRVASAGTRVAQGIWADACDSLGRLRHPLVNALVDYGAADGGRLFEAYAASPPVAARGGVASRLLLHATRFLEWGGVQLAPPLADFALRSIVHSQEAHARPRGGMPVGVMLQHRRVLDQIAEALEHPCAGSVALDVYGGEGSGLRTLHLIVARAARLRGYAPLSSMALVRWPWIADGLLERHLCILTAERATAAERAMVARLLARLGASTSRCHAVIRFHRSEERLPNALRVDPLGVTAMTSMVYIDEDDHSAALFDAARESVGCPGLFLRRLNAAPFDAAGRGAAVVHETAATYAVPARVDSTPSAVLRPKRSDGVAAAACAQGLRLAERGRHAAAARVLSRAFRVLNAQGESRSAAMAALQHGWLLRERGRTEAALQQFERARTIDPHERTTISATLGMAAVWTDDARLHEAEAAARAAGAAAGTLQDPRGACEAALVLARVLWWCARTGEAAAVLEPALADAGWHRAADAWALAARVRLIDRDTCGATAAAREACRLAEACGRPRTVAAASRAAAAAAMASADLPAVRTHVERGLAAARTCHAPLAALRLRILLLRALTAAAPTAPDTHRLAARLRLYLGRPLPRLLRWQLRVACDEADGGAPSAREAARQFVKETGARALLQPLGQQDERRLTDLRRLLELCHAAADDRAALDGLCVELRDRLHAATVMAIGNGSERRRLALAGRPWPGDPHIAFRALESAIAIPVRATDMPPQSAHPVYYGGQIVGVLCCRWTAGSSVDAEHAGDVLRLATLAAAPAIRTLLDRAPASPPHQACPELLGTSDAAATVREAIGRAARAPFPVLIEGESGAGKELVARAVHRLGPRRDRRFCAINCAAITDDLLEAELFGHARGAFTGAIAERAGLFEEADGGTLFLDEIGELSARAQAKLLRVLQDGEVRRVGENFPRRVDARVIAATNRRLADEVAAGRFRADLRFRLDVVRLDVPPLRDRPGDIPVLAAHFWLDASTRVGSAAVLAPDTLAALARYDWPGNVRELQNAIAWMAVHAPRRGRVIPAAVPPHIARAAAPTIGTFDAAREEFERRFIRAALARAAGHRGRAARALGVSRQGLAKMMKRLAIE